MTLQPGGSEHCDSFDHEIFLVYNNVLYLIVRKNRMPDHENGTWNKIKYRKKKNCMSALRPSSKKGMQISENEVCLKRCATASSLALGFSTPIFQGQAHQVNSEAARVPQPRLDLSSDSPEANQASPMAGRKVYESLLVRSK